MTLSGKSSLFTILLFLSGLMLMSNALMRLTETEIINLPAGMYIPEDEYSGIFSQVYFQADSLQLITYQSCFVGNCEQATFQLEQGFQSLRSEDSLTGGFLELYLKQEEDRHMILYGRMSYPDGAAQTFVQRFTRE